MADEYSWKYFLDIIYKVWFSIDIPTSDVN